MIRIDPALAVFRSAPDTVTVGAQRPRIEIHADAGSMTGLAALCAGTTETALAELVGETEAKVLLLQLQAALEKPRLRVIARVRGRVPLATALASAAARSGHAEPDGKQSQSTPKNEIVIPVSPWQLPPAEQQRLTNADALPVTYGDAWVQVGPYSPAGEALHGPGRHRQNCGRPLMPVLTPPHLSGIAHHSAIATILAALNRAERGELKPGWGVCVLQETGETVPLSHADCHCRTRLRIVTAA